MSDASPRFAVMTTPHEMWRDDAEWAFKLHRPLKINSKIQDGGRPIGVILHHHELSRFLIFKMAAVRHLRF